MEVTHHDRPEFARYSILGVLGKGGMGTVYEAHHRILNRRVALKVPKRDLTGDRVFVERFLREAQALGTLHHPHIVTVYDAGIEQGLPYIAMECIDGTALSALIARPAPLAIDDLTRWARELAGALAYLHGRGILHRDLKSSNVLIDAGGRAVLTDFGIAQVDTQVRITRGVIGTPAYMSPEQAQGDTLDARSDLYGLGVVLYEGLTRHLPFEAENTLAMLQKVIHEPPVALKRRRPDVPRWLSRIVMICLEKDPAARFQDGNALARALDARDASAAVRADGHPPQGTPRTAPQPSQRRRKGGWPSAPSSTPPDASPGVPSTPPDPRPPVVYHPDASTPTDRVLQVVKRGVRTLNREAGTAFRRLQALLATARDSFTAAGRALVVARAVTALPTLTRTPEANSEEGSSEASSGAAPSASPTARSTPARFVVTRAGALAVLTGLVVVSLAVIVVQGGDADPSETRATASDPAAPSEAASSSDAGPPAAEPQYWLPWKTNPEDSPSTRRPEVVSPLPDVIQALYALGTHEALLEALRRHRRARTLRYGDKGDVRDPASSYVFLIDPGTETIAALLRPMGPAWVDIVTGQHVIERDGRFYVRVTEGRRVTEMVGPFTNMQAIWVRLAE